MNKAKEVTTLTLIMSISLITAGVSLPSGIKQLRNNNNYFLEKTFKPSDKLNIQDAKISFERLAGCDVSSLLNELQFFGSIPVINEANIESCYFFDFNGENGYAIFDDSSIYKIEEHGDFPLLRSGEIFYSLSGDFLKLNEENNSFSRVDISNGKIDENSVENGTLSKSYEVEDGDLLDSALTDYVSSVHRDWIFDDSKIIGNFSVRSMDTNSFYINQTTYKDGHLGRWYTEGNCAPNAMFSYLYNLPTTNNSNGNPHNYCPKLKIGRHVTDRFSMFASYNDAFSSELSDNYYDLTDDGKYQSSSNKPDSEISSKIHWVLKQSSNSTWTQSTDLYWNIRCESIKKGYDPRFGLDMGANSESILETVSKNDYGYPIDIIKTDVASNVIANIQDDIPVVVSTSGSKTYGSHGMVIYGFRKYHYTANTFLWFTETRYSYLWLVDDCWASDGNKDRRWFDPNRGSSNTFFTTNKNSLFWGGC